MASQRLTIAKVGGEAAKATLRIFGEWSRARLVDDQNEWSPEQWPEDTRRCADAWATELRHSGHKPPVLFYVEYVDLWSSCPPLRHIGPDSLIQVMADRYELFCLPLPMSGALMGRLQHVRDQGQWDEDHLFASLVLKAASAWNEIVDTAILVFLRQVIGAAVEDQEIQQSLTEVPGWLEPI